MAVDHSQPRPESTVDILVAELPRLGLALTGEQQRQFGCYQTLLLDWNRRINLTAITEPTAVQLRHFFDSLSCVLVTGNLNGLRLVDVGSGAGFPGLPLKILFPEMALTLVESVGKKARFLTAVVEALELTQVQIVAERAEVLGQAGEFRGQYDWAVARSVAALPILAEYLLPLCRLGGHLLAQKGEQAAVEVTAAERALTVLGGGAARLQEVEIPGAATPHYLVVVEKITATPAAYPRRPGRPAKRPLQ